MTKRYPSKASYSARAANHDRRMRDDRDLHAELVPHIRDGRYWAGGYSSDSKEGLQRILNKLKQQGDKNAK